ncbi:metalloregulator ArsR/SmtB family transcription factor [Streptomyces sp. NPDC091215]|uniref:ArsR/SmtB family transcription factor n=1 Tax=Streptomyces sp. NPDC091215 TaxID=3155192 RepID=UPI00341A2511
MTRWPSNDSIFFEADRTIGGLLMIRINLGAHGLGKVRFAMSPLDATEDLLFAVGRSPRLLGAAWRAQAVQALSDHRLGLLAVVAGGGQLGYAPDFLRPEPTGSQVPLDSALHQVATTPPERVRYEMTGAIGGHTWDQPLAHRPPRMLLETMNRGEEYLAQRMAVELERFWHAVLAPHWPGIRARLEGDVAARASAIARHGIADTINHLAPNLDWNDGALNVRLPATSSHCLSLNADGAILVPSVFASRAIFCAAEPPGAPAPRTPLIVYPAAPNDCLPPSGGEELIGTTRLRLLAELTQPRATGELARLLHLSPATISYHLQILYRAGLVQRTRRSRTVLYQRLAVKPGYAGDPG